MTRQEEIILEKYNSIINSCPYYPNCYPECEHMELCNHIISTAKSIHNRINS